MTAYVWVTIRQWSCCRPCDPLVQGLGHVLHHLSGILVEHGILLRDQEAVVVLPQNSHELEDGVGAAHFQIGEVAIQPAENARVVAADIEDLLAHG